jgi:hypothetical protein
MTGDNIDQIFGEPTRWICRWHYRPVDRRKRLLLNRYKRKIKKIILSRPIPTLESATPTLELKLLWHHAQKLWDRIEREAIERGMGIG